ncbi:hypothetical protein Patl1_27646 [Pistacia atlantica]|uniref:Uncharacterized protein n=1 Tax=Pistacia atlantica TaxID=434234 RepID=A0ACC1BFQ2_9ROSI|nr:hypothetical protein Patl1_27646 [Pistacia atlantica]
METLVDSQNLETELGSLNRDMKNAFMSKSEQYQTPQPQAFSSINTGHLMTTMIPPKMEPIAEEYHNHKTINIPDKKSKDFSWQDFLLEDALLSANRQVQDSTLEFSSKDFSNNSHNVTPRSQINNENNIQINNGVKGNGFFWRSNLWISCFIIH